MLAVLPDAGFTRITGPDEASVSDLFERLGAVDHLVIPGSSVKTGAFREMPLADGLFTMQSKFWGPFLCAKYARINPGVV